MKTIDIVVRDRVALSPHAKMVCGNSDYYVRFDFDSEWDAYYTKTARFVYNGTFVDVPFDGDTVNAPIIVNASIVAVGVYSGELCTTTPALIATDKSILCGGGLPADPTPDVYEQIITLVGTKGNVKTVNGNAPDESGNVEVQANVQPNWDQNDETALDYVKNRTHWVGKGTLFDDTITTVNNDGFIACVQEGTFGLVAGQTYTVEWKGVTYESVAVERGGLVIVGDAKYWDFESTGEPFAIAEAADENAKIFLEYNGTPETIAVKIVGETVHKLDSKYIDFPTYTAADVGALPDTTVIPTVPTNVSAFTNDAGYAKKSDIPSLDGYATETFVNDTVANIDIPTGTLFVTFTQSGGTYTADKTFAEVAAAVESGASVVGKWNSMIFALDSIDSAYAYFTCHQYRSGYIYVFTLGANRVTMSVAPRFVGNALTFTGAVEATFNGQNPVSVEIPTGGEVTDEQIAAAVETYLTEKPVEETDPTVPEWAKAETKPTYTAAEVGALPDTTEIPSIEGLATEKYVDDAIAGIDIPEVDIPTDEHINELIDAKLGVIENGTY